MEPQELLLKHAKESARVGVFRLDKITKTLGQKQLDSSEFPKYVDEVCSTIEFSLVKKRVDMYDYKGAHEISDKNSFVIHTFDDSFVSLLTPGREYTMLLSPNP